MGTDNEILVIGFWWVSGGGQQNNISKLGRLDLLHQHIVVLAPPNSQMLWHSDPVCKVTKANKALTGNSVLVSAVPVKQTGTVTVMVT